MPKSKLSNAEKLIQHEEKHSSLIASLKKQFGELIYKNGGLNIDEKLLIGVIRFINDEKNKNNPILEEFKNLGAKTNPPSKRIKISPIGTKKND